MMAYDFPEKYRQDWESDEHWEYRKAFLIRHQGKFENDDRLLCLSQLYSNIHHLGCRYSPAVMRKLAELESDSDQRRQQTSSVKHKFSSDTDQLQTSKRSKQCHHSDSESEKSNKEKQQNAPDKNVSYGNQSDSKETLPLSLSGLRELIQELQKKDGDQNLLQVFQVATSKLHIDMKCLIDSENNTKPSSTNFVCSLYLNDFLIASGSGSSKKQARIDAHNNALDRLSKSNFSPATGQVNTKVNTPLLSSTKERTSLPTSQEVVCNRRCPGIENLVIMEDSDVDPNQNAIFVLTRTANYNQAQLQFEYSNAQDDCLTTCVIMLEGSLLAMAKGRTKQEAKQSAADAALTAMKKQAYTVKVKPEMSEEKVVTKDVLREATEGKAITEDNVGYKLLQLMGWKKGSEENSCAEAAKTHDSFGREGLGFSEKRSVTKDFVGQLEKIISAYASSNTDADLVFSTEFNKEERKEIHRIAGKYALRSNSRGGQGTERHAVLSRRFAPYDLVQYLLDCGGVTRKYELIPPGNNS